MPPGPMNAMLRLARRSARAGSFASAPASLPCILEKSKLSKVFGSFLGSRLSLRSVSIDASLLFSAR